MLRLFVITLSFVYPMSLWADSEIAAVSVANELTEMAKDAEVRIEFSVDPNDDTTLVIHRVSNLRPNELSGDWTFYLLSIGSSPDYLKEKGFNKVRIYTSQSLDINDYVLKIL